MQLTSKSKLDFLKNFIIQKILTYYFLFEVLYGYAEYLTC
jgi:hypothetical protein